MSGSAARSAWKRAFTAAGAAVVIAGLLGVVAPTAAQAAPKTKITGAVTFAAQKTLKLDRNGYVEVYTSKCRYVEDAQISFKNNKYTITVPKGGSYRVVYSGWQQAAKAPYGTASSDCLSAKTVKVQTGKTAKNNLTVKAKGLTYVTGKKLKKNEYFVFYNSTGKREVSWAGLNTQVQIAPGSYKLAKIKWVKNKAKVVKVYGTSSKKTSKGKTIRVSAAKAIKIDFDKSKIAKTKTFSYKAKLKLGGAAKPGKTLKAKLSGLPKGTKVKVQWYRVASDPWKETKIAGATKSSYKVKASDRNHELYAVATATKSGYLPSTFYSSNWKKVAGLKLKQKSSQKTTGLTGGYYAQVGTAVQVTPATFTQSGVKVTYDWRNGHGEKVSSAKSYTPNDSESGEYFSVTVTYKKAGYTTVYRYFGFEVAQRELTEVAPPSLDGTIDGTWDEGFIAAPEATVAVTDAEFAEGDVDASYEWTEYLSGGGYEVRTGPSFEAGPDTESVSLTVTYSKSGYADATYDTWIEFPLADLVPDADGSVEGYGPNEEGSTLADKLLTHEAATFAEGVDDITYNWYFEEWDDVAEEYVQVSLGTDSGYTTTSADAARGSVNLQVTYTKAGFEPYEELFFFSVVE